MELNAWSKDLSVEVGGHGVVSHAGSAVLRLLADNTGLTATLSKALRRRGFIPVHDRRPGCGRHRRPHCDREGPRAGMGPGVGPRRGTPRPRRCRGGRADRAAARLGRRGRPGQLARRHADHLPPRTPRLRGATVRSGGARRLALPSCAPPTPLASSWRCWKPVTASTPGSRTASAAGRPPAWTISRRPPWRSTRRGAWPR